MIVITGMIHYCRCLLPLSVLLWCLYLVVCLEQLNSMMKLFAVQRFYSTVLFACDYFVCFNQVTPQTLVCHCCQTQYV